MITVKNVRQSKHDEELKESANHLSGINFCHQRFEPDAPGI
jgi:hypothetical protein